MNCTFDFGSSIYFIRVDKYTHIRTVRHLHSGKQFCLCVLFALFTQILKLIISNPCGQLNFLYFLFTFVLLSMGPFAGPQNDTLLIEQSWAGCRIVYA